MGRFRCGGRSWIWISSPWISCSALRTISFFWRDFSDGVVTQNSAWSLYYLDGVACLFLNCLSIKTCGTLNRSMNFTVRTVSKTLSFYDVNHTNRFNTFPLQPPAV